MDRGAWRATVHGVQSPTRLQGILAHTHLLVWASTMAQMVKNPPAMQEPWVQSLHWENVLEEGMTTHSSITAWRIHMDRVLRAAVMRSQE